MDVLLALAAFVVVITTIVGIHEYGHYIACRKLGLGVRAFSIGFGPVLWRRTDRHGCEWRISALPLGGYVQPGPGFPEECSATARGVMAAAGPLVNLVFGFLLLWGWLVLVGAPGATTLVSGTVPGMPAEAAGVQTGDRIVSVNGTKVVLIADMAEVLHETHGRAVAVEVQRADGRTDTVTMTPVERDGRWLLGLNGTTQTIQVPPSDAAGYVVSFTWRIATGIGKALLDIATLSPNNDIGGPVRIAAMSGQALADGVSTVFVFIGAMSINLGLFNLVPLPGFDGWHICASVVRGVTGWRPGPEAAKRLALFQAACILTLIVLVLGYDLRHYGVFERLGALIGL